MASPGDEDDDPCQEYKSRSLVMTRGARPSLRHIRTSRVLGPEWQAGPGPQWRVETSPRSMASLGTAEAR